MDWGLGIGVGELTKRNILTVWILAMEAVGVIEAGGREVEELELA